LNFVDDGAQSFFLSLPAFFVACKQPKKLAASKGYHVIIINNVGVKVIAGREKGTAEKE
jgi:hypothetical protein